MTEKPIDASHMWVQLLQAAVKNGASDIHITPGQKPAFRVHGDLRRLDTQPLSKAVIKEMLGSILNGEQRLKFDSGNDDIDSSLSLENSRFRINVSNTDDGPAIVARVLDPKIPELKNLGLPPKINELIHAEKGLLLVTGATGSGKSTSIAAMIHELNKHKKLKIITIEDPIEYKHTPIASDILHREVGTSAPSFAKALKSALRQDPDVILIGELRDRETAIEAIRAAETGHLVLSTVHTGSAAQAADRIVGMFPAEEQEGVRNGLASNLLGVLTQQLVPRADGKGRVAATELLVSTPAVKHAIQSAKTPTLADAIQTGMKEGMIPMARSLRNLMDTGVISREQYQEAIKKYEREGGKNESHAR